MKRMITVLFLLVATNAVAQGDTLKARKARSKTNEEVIVKAIVAGSKIIDKDGKRILILSLDKPYPNTPLQVIFFYRAYTDLNLQYLLDGKTIIVKGTVTSYNGRSQIIVDDVQNFTVLPN